MIHVMKLKNLALLALFALSFNAYATTFYQIEVIIFDQATRAALDSQVFPEPRQLPDMTHARPVADMPAAALPLQEGVISAMQKTSDYQVIGHFAWLQEGWPKNNATPVLIRNRDVEGVITFSHNRFAHIDSNIIYTRNGYGGANSFQLRASERVDYNKLYYFDNPIFGMLVIVKPYS